MMTDLELCRCATAIVYRCFLEIFFVMMENNPNQILLTKKLDSTHPDFATIVTLTLAQHALTQSFQEYSPSNLLDMVAAKCPA